MTAQTLLILGIVHREAGHVVGEWLDSLRRLQWEGDKLLHLVVDAAVGLPGIDVPYQKRTVVQADKPQTEGVVLLREQARTHALENVPEAGLVLWCDADCLPYPDLAERLARHLKQYPAAMPLLPGVGLPGLKPQAQVVEWIALACAMMQRETLRSEEWATAHRRVLLDPEAHVVRYGANLVGKEAVAVGEQVQTREWQPITRTMRRQVDSIVYKGTHRRVDLAGHGTFQRDQEIRRGEHLPEVGWDQLAGVIGQAKTAHAAWVTRAKAGLIPSGTPPDYDTSLVAFEVHHSDDEILIPVAPTLPEPLPVVT